MLSSYLAMVWTAWFNSTFDPQYVVETTLVVSTYVMWPVIITLNVLVISVIAVFRELKTPQNLLLLSLAVADLMTAFLFIPTYTANYWATFRGDLVSFQRLSSVEDGHNNSLAPYPLDVYAGQLSLLASVNHLVIIALDMFASVLYPLWHHRVVTLRVARTTIIVVWGTTLTTVCLPMSTAFVDAFQEAVSIGWFSIMLYITLFLTMLALLLNSIVYHKLRQIKENIRRRASISEKIRTNDSAATSVFIFSVFVVMWTPFLVIILLGEHTASTERKTFGLLRTVALISVVANSLADPIIYLKKKRHFKRAYALLLTTSPCRWNNMKLFNLRRVASSREFSTPITTSTSIWHKSAV